MAWFAMNNRGLFPMSILSKAGEEGDDGSLPVRQLRGTGMVSTPRGRMMNPESLKFQLYDPKRYEAEYRAIVDKYGVSSKEARHFHLRNRAALAATLSDGITNNPDRHTDYESVYGDNAKSNARLAHVQGSGRPSGKDARFHASHANSSLDPDPELHDAISDYAHKLQSFIQRAYTMAAGRGGSGGGGKHGASMEQVVGQLVNLKYKQGTSQANTPSTSRSDEEEASVEQALKGILGAKAAHQYALATAGSVLRALQKAKEAAKKITGADGKPLDLYKDRLLTAPAYFHEIFSGVGKTNPSDVQLESHHQDAAEWGKVGQNTKTTDAKRPIDDYYGFLERLKPGVQVPVTATKKAGNQDTMLEAQKKKDNSGLVTDRVEVNPATDMMAPQDREGAIAGSRDVTRREYYSPTETFHTKGKDITVPGALRVSGDDTPIRSGSSHIGVTKDISSSHGGENAPVTQGFHKLTENFNVAPGDVRLVGANTVTAFSGRHQGYNPDDDDFAPGASNLGSAGDFRVDHASGSALHAGRLAADETRIHRVVGPNRGSVDTGTSFRRRSDNQSELGKRPNPDAE